MTSLIDRARRASTQTGPHLETAGLLLAMLSPVQRRFVKDPARRKLARCSRRSGKTFVDAVYLILTCLSAPKMPVLYAGLTRDSAKEAIWGMLLEMLEQLHIPHTPRPSQLMIEFPNGSKITIFGCDQQNARNRLRGRKFALVIFDETGFYAALDPLVYAVLPMLADYGGTICLTSSPGELLKGLFYEADEGSKAAHWSRYHWTIHDNPLFMKSALDPRFKTRAEEEVGLVLETEYDGNAADPGFRREWLGEWVEDATSLVYPLSAANLIGAPYKVREQLHGIGIELGSSFMQSVAVGRFSPYTRYFQVIKQWTRQDLDMDEYMALVGREVDAYKPVAITAHVGEFSPAIVDELRKRYRLPITAMGAKDKSFHQRVFSNDLQAGYIQLVSSATGQLQSEYGKIVKNHDGDEIPGQDNYGANAALSLYRKVHQTTLAAYEAPLSEEEQHIKQLEERRFQEPALWMDEQ